MQNKQSLYALAWGMMGLTAATTLSANPTMAAGKGASPPLPVPSVASTVPLAAGVVNSNEITGVSVASIEGGTRITITGTQSFTPDIRSVSGNFAAVVTVPGIWKAGNTNFIMVAKNNVYNVRAGQFANKPERLVRVVANTKGSLRVTAMPSPDKKVWEVMVWATAVRPVVATIKPVVVLAPPTVPTAFTSALDTRHFRLAETPSVAPKVETSITDAAAVANAEENPTVLLAAATPNAPVVTPAAVIAPVVVVPAPIVTAPPVVPVALSPASGVGGPYPALLRPTPVGGLRRAARSTATAVVLAPSEKRVSLDFAAAEIVDVLKALSLQSGLNIVAGSDVKGVVTVSLKNVPMIEALDMVARLSGFRYAKVGSTYVVGTGASVAALSRGSSVGEAISETIPFYYSDGKSLEDSIQKAFPSANVSRVDAGDDAKKDDSGYAPLPAGAFPAAAVAGTAPGGENPAAAAPKTAVSQPQTGRGAKPRGGVMNVVGTTDEVTAIRRFIEGTEEGLITSSRRVQDAETRTLASMQTETYRLKYAAPGELVGILSNLVPNVRVQFGPTQAFQPRTLNGSASFSGSSSPGGATAGGGAGSGTGAASGGASAAPTTGPVPPSQLPPTLILTGSPADLTRARDVLAQIDVRSAQLTFQARVMDINSQDLQKLGLRYDLSRAVQLGEPNLKNQGTAPNVGATYNDDLRKPNFGTIFRSPYSISATLDAIANNNRARTLASPNLSALDGQSATVFIGDQIKYVINIQNTPQGQNVQTETATVGITLKVTGKYSPDGTITLYVHPEVSSVSSYVTLANGIALPQIATRFVDTTIRVRDGETVGIGGLIREDDIKNIQKVPLLGDLPFFGQLFRSSNTTKAKSEVVVFITSRLLKE